MNNPASYARLGGLAVLWGASFLLIKIALEALSPTQLAFARIALGALVLLALCAVRRVHLLSLRVPAERRLWGRIAIAGLLGNTLPWLLFAVGEQTVASGLTGVINATTPLWTIMFALLFRTERSLTPIRFAGLLVGFLGVVVIFAPWQGGDMLTWGVLACLGAPACYGLAFVYIGRAMTATREHGTSMPPLGFATMQLSAATVFAALALPIGGLTSIEFTPLPLLAITVLGIFGTGFAFAINFRIITDEGATTASTVTYLIPLVSVLLGWLVLGEQLLPRVIIGMAIVLAGVALGQRKPGVKAAKPDPELATSAKR